MNRRQRNDFLALLFYFGGMWGWTIGTSFTFLPTLIGNVLLLGIFVLFLFRDSFTTVKIQRKDFFE